MKKLIFILAVFALIGDIPLLLTPGIDFKTKFILIYIPYAIIKFIFIIFKIIEFIDIKEYKKLQNEAKNVLNDPKNN